MCVCVWHVRWMFIHKGLGVIDSSFCPEGPPLPPSLPENKLRGLVCWVPQFHHLDNNLIETNAINLVMSRV